MKKIGLVSYHREANFGTMFQAYALAEVIKQSGKACEYIDYYESLKKPVFYSFIRKLAGQLYHLLRLPSRGDFGFFDSLEFRDILNAFNSFHSKYIPVSKERYFYNSLNGIEDEYDLFIVGSDQTWSKAMNMNPYSINFLPFIEDHNKKRSYAPSIGTIHINKEFERRLKRELSSFSYISCRERPNCVSLSSLLGKDVYYVLDPTLLLTKSEWLKVAHPFNLTEKFILAYILGSKKCVADFAEKLGKANGLPVYYLITSPEYLDRQNSLSAVGPSEFISIISQAEYVVTDSFHGTIFSINFNRQFYSFAKRESSESSIDNDRISCFLKEVHLENRFKKDDDVHFEADIEFGEVNKIVSQLRKESYNYLSLVIE